MIQVILLSVIIIIPLAVSSFLSVYTSSGDDWHGVLIDYSEDVVTDENLIYTGS